MGREAPSLLSSGPSQQQMAAGWVGADGYRGVTPAHEASRSEATSIRQPGQERPQQGPAVLANSDTCGTQGGAAPWKDRREKTSGNVGPRSPSPGTADRSQCLSGLCVSICSSFRQPKHPPALAVAPWPLPEPAARHAGTCALAAVPAPRWVQSPPRDVP